MSQSLRRMRRFFSPEPLAKAKPGDEVRLSFEETVHLKNVIRLKAGDPCLVTDGQGAQAEARVGGFPEDGRACLVLGNIQPAGAKDRPEIRVYTALLQKGKTDGLVEKLQELEADAMIPVETERTIVKMTAADASKVVKRWYRIASEAAKQSGSLSLLRLSTPISYKEAIAADLPGMDKVIFHPDDDDAVPFRDWSAGLRKDARLALYFGPEGGFAEREVRDAEAGGFKKVRLSANVLKADTAIVGVVASLRYLFP